MVLIKIISIVVVLIFLFYFICKEQLKAGKELKKKVIKKAEINYFNNIPEKDLSLIKEKAFSDVGFIFKGNGKYEYCTYVEKGHKFIFYPHKTSQGNVATRIRIANPAVVSDEKVKILKDFIKMGFHCKSLPKNYK